MEPQTLQEPPTDQGSRMRAIVIQNQMHVQAGRDGGLDRVEELPELHGSMPLVELPNDSPGLALQGGEEGCGVMAVVVMRAALHLAGSQWQQRARPIQGLNLRFLIDAQDQRF